MPLWDGVTNATYDVSTGTQKVSDGGGSLTIDTTAGVPLETTLQPDAASPLFDAFGRLRVSEPYSLLASKQTLDNLPLVFDDAEVSGASTTSTHSTARASSMLLVAATTAGKRVRQSRRRMNYQPGKSQFIKITGVLDYSGGGTGITRGMGYYDDDNGIFLQDDAGTINLVRRSSVTGSPVDEDVAQASWNIDPFDGTGPSGVTLDFTKSQIFVIDMEWLGVGSVRTGFVIDGRVWPAHQFRHANSLAGVYMSTPNLPVRWEIENDGTGAASEIETICAEVESEGGVQPLGLPRFKDVGSTHIDANTAGTIYALIGIRLKAAALQASVIPMAVSLMETASTSVDGVWCMFFNPTVAGTFTYSDEPNSAVQTAIGATANTITGGTPLQGDLMPGGKNTVISVATARNLVSLGAAIDGTPDEIVLGYTPYSNNADVYAALNWFEQA